MTEPYDITTDSELKTAVYGETQYDENQLSQSDLTDLIDSAKRVMALKAGVTSFYDDRGLGVT